MKEQTTLRLSEVLVKSLEAIAEAEDTTVSALIISAAKRIVKRYKFDERGKLIV